jgi:hypothetical protein
MIRGPGVVYMDKQDGQDEEEKIGFRPFILSILSIHV